MDLCLGIGFSILTVYVHRYSVCCLFVYLYVNNSIRVCKTGALFSQTFSNLQYFLFVPEDSFFLFLYNLESAILVHEPVVLVALERVYDRYIDHDFIAQNKNVS